MTNEARGLTPIVNAEYMHYLAIRMTDQSTTPSGKYFVENLRYIRGAERERDFMAVLDHSFFV